MNFDDRLATVLRQRAAGENAMVTQFRQLLDLVGRAPADGLDEDDRRDVFARLDRLIERLPEARCVAILQSPETRLRNAPLLAHLSDHTPAIAAAALSHARLGNDDWANLIPQLPVRARGFLRLRRNLPADTIRALERLGIHDRGLPRPAGAVQSEQTAPQPTKDVPIAANDTAKDAANDAISIGALVKRIENFRASRTGEIPTEAPRLPLNDAPTMDRSVTARFGFTTDAAGRIDWAEGRVAPMLIGTRLSRGPLAQAIKRRQPIDGATLPLGGAALIAGDWIVDAAPRFTDHGGRFYGYAGLARRPSDGGRMAMADDTATTESDRLRQLLHELRTPMNAIQGFAEIIQQQTFGPAPHDYRAMAATIAGDSARMLAGFDELDRLAKLETGVMPIETGVSDFAAIVAALVAKLQTVLAPKSAAFNLDTYAVGMIAFSHDAAERMAWRLLASVANAMEPSEHLGLEFTAHGGQLHLHVELPATLAQKDDLFTASAPRKDEPLTTGMFGAGFALRLVRAEAAAAGGRLSQAEGWLTLNLPLLTAASTEPSEGPVPGTREAEQAI
ncbi:MAG: histidine kinase dimerization/phospho-acceptor domain-containing protein [Pontixanthobacter sp.]